MEERYGITISIVSSMFQAQSYIYIYLHLYTSVQKPKPRILYSFYR